MINPYIVILCLFYSLNEKILYFLVHGLLVNNSIDRTLISGLVIVALVGGLVFSPIFTGHIAEALQPTCSPITKSVTLIAGETVVQIAPANPFWPGVRHHHSGMAKQWQMVSCNDLERHDPWSRYIS